MRGVCLCKRRLLINFTYQQQTNPVYSGGIVPESTSSTIPAPVSIHTHEVQGRQIAFYSTSQSDVTHRVGQQNNGLCNWARESCNEVVEVKSSDNGASRGGRSSGYNFTARRMAMKKAADDVDGDGGEGRGGVRQAVKGFRSRACASCSSARIVGLSRM